MPDFHKNWQVETQGQIYEADFDELTQWIAEGAILPSDRVRRGNLRWLYAEKVPELQSFFNDNYNPSSLVITASTPEDMQFLSQWEFESAAATGETQENAGDGNVADLAAVEPQNEGVCFFHQESEAVYTCDICTNSFCKICPNSFGTVKICPVCGAMCRDFDESPETHKSIGTLYRPYSREELLRMQMQELALQNGGSGKSASAGGNRLSWIVASAFFLAILVAAFMLFFS